MIRCWHANFRNLLTFHSWSFKQMSQMREIVVHDYDGINYMIIWDTVTKEIPPLEERMESLLRALEYEEQDSSS